MVPSLTEYISEILPASAWPRILRRSARLDAMTFMFSQAAICATRTEDIPIIVTKTTDPDNSFFIIPSVATNQSADLGLSADNDLGSKSGSGQTRGQGCISAIAGERYHIV